MYRLFFSVMVLLVHFGIYPAMPVSRQLLDENGFNSRQIKEINAVLTVYGGSIEKAILEEDDICFLINGISIYYRNGKMLSKKNLGVESEYQSIFYRYKMGPQTEVPKYSGPISARASDFHNALYGFSIDDIQRSCKVISFLNRKILVNEACVQALYDISNSIYSAAAKSSAVMDFIDEIRIISSYNNKKVIGTGNISFHSYGLAVDIIPRSYDNKSVYWGWSSVFNKDWSRIPLSGRWSPPAEVIEAFEENGFIWGGKWVHFDTIHFEYRPEILAASGDN